MLGLTNAVLALDALATLCDLTEVTLVDSEVVPFLVQCEKQGVRLANCPAYIPGNGWSVRAGGPL